MTPIRILIAALVLIGFGACGDPSPAAEPAPAEPAEPAADPQAQIARGEHLVITAGCHDCHTPWAMGANGPAPDMSRALSGHPADLQMPAPPPTAGPWVIAASGTMTAWSGPWGVSFTANLTPDPETGIGTWDEETFIATIRNNRHMGRGRPLMPPMPSPNLAQMTDDELRAVFAYLRTIPVISNRVPENLPPTVAAL